MSLAKRVFSLLSLIVLTFFVFSPGTTMAALDPEQKKLLSDQVREFNIKDDECVTPASTGASVTDGSAVDKFLQALAMKESRGNAKAANPGSSARGKYQYLTSTWHSKARQYYMPADQYPSGDRAPEAVQDALVKIEYTDKAKQFNNDPFKMAISHFYPAANSNPDLLNKHIGPASNPTPRQYADAVVKYINDGSAAHIGLHYSQAPEFNTFFVKVNNGQPSNTPSQPSGNTATQVSTNPNACQTNVARGGSANCGKYPLLKIPEGGGGVATCYVSQGELSSPDGSFSWPGCGCEPTSTYMMRLTFEGNPNLGHMEVLAGVRQAGGVVSNCLGALPSGGWLNRYLGGLNKGYSVQKVHDRSEGALSDADLTKAKELMSAGYVMLAHTHNFIDAANTRATIGHYLLVYGYDKEGNFYVANPGNRNDKDVKVPPSKIKTWLDEFYAVTKGTQV